jgi:hypothetical protein
VWCWTALANRAKWPPAVFALAAMLRAEPALLHSAGAEDLRRGLQRMIVACDGRPMKEMHAQLSASGHMHSTQGLAVLALDAGLLEDYVKPKRQKGSPVPSPPPDVVRLGCAGHEYVWAKQGPRRGAMSQVGRRRRDRARLRVSASVGG